MGRSDYTSPPVYILERGFLHWVMGLFSVSGITLWPFGIYFYEGIYNSFDIFHEKIHWQQQKEMLGLFFYLWYVMEWLVRVFDGRGDAYMRISFEREAWKNELNIDYVKYRKRYAWFKYINFTDMGFKKFLRVLSRDMVSLVMIVFGLFFTVAHILWPLNVELYPMVFILLIWVIVQVYNYYAVWDKVDRFVMDDMVRHQQFSLGRWNSDGTRARIGKEDLTSKIFRIVFYVAIVAVMVIVVLDNV